MKKAEPPAERRDPYDPEGESHWQAAAAEVQRLGVGSKRPSGAKHNPRRLPLNRAERDAREAEKTRQLPPAPQLAKSALVIVSSTAERLAGHVAGFDMKRFRELSEGKVGYAAQLDLHGMYEGDAYLMLANWLQAACQAEVRCALVICGKGRGYGDAGDMGLIKAQLAGWLANHPAVLAFHSAMPRDGGSGAVYVFLRRWR